MRESLPSTFSADQSTDTSQEAELASTTPVRSLDSMQAQDKTTSTNLQPATEPTSLTPSLDNKHTSSTTPKKIVDSSRTILPTSLLQWQQDRQDFLVAVRAMLRGTATIDMEVAWQTLCQTYGNNDTITVLEWEFLFRDLHNTCKPVLVCELLETKSDAKHTSSELDTLSRQALPPTAPMQWRVIACANQAEADEHTQSLSSSSSATSITLITCTLFYWQTESGLQLCYNQTGQKPYTVAARDLPPASLTRSPDPYVANSLWLLHVHVHGHPELKPELMQVLFEHLHHKKRLVSSPPSAKTDTSPPCIIRQQRLDGAVYYGQWFSLSTTSTPTEPLPGGWTTVYPSSEAGSPTEISDCRGWVRLQEPTHTLLLQQLRRVDAQQQAQHQYALVCRLYPQWEQSVKRHLSQEIQLRWHTTLANSAADYPAILVMRATTTSFLSPPDPIVQGYKALICAKQLADDKVTVSKINCWLDDLVQAKIKILLQPLLADYQQQWAVALAPLQQPNGKLSLADFQSLCSLAPRLLSQLLWLDATKARKAYVDLKATCNERQNDIFTQLQTLVSLKNPTSAEQQTLQNWRQALQNLFTVWRDYGDNTIATTWCLALNPVLPPTQPLPEEASLQQRVLADLEQGFRGLQPADSLSPSLPTIWEEAHRQTLAALTRYAALGQKSAFQQLKQRYGLRLRSYRQACIVLNQADPRYSALGDWLQRSYAELKILSSELLSTQAPPPLPWHWQSAHEMPPNPTQLFSQMCKHIHQQLLTPPCVFEIVACMRPTWEEPGQLYSNSDNEKHT